jgi:hypothetical protein
MPDLDLDVEDFISYRKKFQSSVNAYRMYSYSIPKSCNNFDESEWK